MGLSETEANERNVPHAVTVYGIDDLDRAIADGEAHGFVKVLTAPGTDRILGVTIVGEHAGDLIAEYVLAMKHGLGLEKILGTIHVYPDARRGEQVRRGRVEAVHHHARAMGGAGRLAGVAARGGQLQRGAPRGARDAARPASGVCEVRSRALTDRAAR